MNPIFTRHPLHHAAVLRRQRVVCLEELRPDRRFVLLGHLAQRLVADHVHRPFDRFVAERLRFGVHEPDTSPEGSLPPRGLLTPVFHPVHDLQPCLLRGQFIRIGTPCKFQEHRRDRKELVFGKRSVDRGRRLFRRQVADDRVVGLDGFGAYRMVRVRGGEHRHQPRRVLESHNLSSCWSSPIANICWGVNISRPFRFRLMIWLAGRTTSCQRCSFNQRDASMTYPCCHFRVSRWFCTAFTIMDARSESGFSLVQAFTAFAFPSLFGYSCQKTSNSGSSVGLTERRRGISCLLSSPFISSCLVSSLLPPVDHRSSSGRPPVELVLRDSSRLRWLLSRSFIRSSRNRPP